MLETYSIPSLPAAGNSVLGRADPDHGQTSSVSALSRGHSLLLTMPTCGEEAILTRTLCLFAMPDLSARYSSDCFRSIDTMLTRCGRSSFPPQRHPCQYFRVYPYGQLLSSCPQARHSRGALPYRIGGQSPSQWDSVVKTGHSSVWCGVLTKHSRSSLSVG